MLNALAFHLKSMVLNNVERLLKAHSTIQEQWMSTVLAKLEVQLVWSGVLWLDLEGCT